MDAMIGRGKLGDWDLVAAFYGRGGLADGRTLRSTEAWTGRTGADGVDWGGLDRLVDRQRGGQGGLRNRGRGGLGRTGRTGWTGADGADGGVLGRAWRGVRGGLGSLGRA